MKGACGFSGDGCRLPKSERENYRDGWCTRGRRRRLLEQLKVVTKSSVEREREKERKKKKRVLFFVGANMQFFTNANVMLQCV